MHHKVPPLGSVFLVPLRDAGYALGVLARASGKGPAFGYFFGPRITKLEEVDWSKFTPADAILVGQFGDLGLIRTEWPVIGVVDNWEAGEWPLPLFGRVDKAADRAWVSTYDDGLSCIAEQEVTPEVASQYPYDRLMGAGAVEIRLTRLVSEREHGQVGGV